MTSDGDGGVDLEALADLTTPWALRVVVTLRIAELVDTGLSGIDELAAAARCDAENLHNVLGHLVGKGVFEEPSPGRFALNTPARALTDPALRIGLDQDDIGGRFSGAWGTLLAYVRAGAPAYAEAFGRPFWEDLDAHPDLAARFDDLIGPEGHGIPDASLELTGGWDGVRTVLDVGGGTGAMLAELLRAHPGVRGTLVDLPRTVARSVPVFAAAGVAERVTTVGQSFFDPLPAGADLYVLRGVINDWPDREAALILRRCADAARPGGRVVVMKGVRADDARRGLATEMVLVGGKRRTVAEMGELARSAGVEVVAAGPQPSGTFVVECRPT